MSAPAFIGQTKLRLVLVLCLALALIAAAVVLVLARWGNAGEDAAPRQHPGNQIGIIKGPGLTPVSPVDGDQPTIGWPNAYSMSLSEAIKEAKFMVRLPDTTSANAENLSDVFLEPGGSLFLEYPAAPADVGETRQPNIEVFEAVWVAGDPLTQYEADSRYSPVVGKSLCKVASFDALCVEPNSPTDFEKMNAAYVSFVVDNVEIEVSGGSSLDRVLSIANSVAKAN